MVSAGEKPRTISSILSIGELRSWENDSGPLAFANGTKYSGSSEDFGKSLDTVLGF